MKMNKPYIEIVRFDAEDVIATSGVVNCTVSSLTSGDRILHRNNQNNSYFVYDYTANTNTPVEQLGSNTELRHNGGTTQYTSGITYDGSSTGYSAYIYDGHGDWSWWNEDPNASHGDY